MKVTDICPITQFSAEHQKRWPNLHNALIGELEFPTSAEIPPEALAKLNDDIHDMLSKQLENSKKDKSRDKLFGFLKQILEYRFPGSKLDKFGSTVTGLSLAQGDLDLCLQISGTVPHKVFNKIGKVLRKHDFVDVVVIPHAKVPIVKCRDAKTGIPLDISVNNTLALHNTQLLKTYSMQDARVSQTILAIKYWAMCRDVSDAPSGTFSSYAWSLLSIQSMQMTTPPLVANVQSGKKRNIQHVEGDDYDVTIHPNPMSLLKKQNQQTLGEIVVHFFETFANWDWNTDICSIRNGAALSREEKGWLEQDPTAIEIIINEESKRVGKHSLAIEDPFDLKRDLSTVLRAEGVMDIHEEILRMWFGICRGDSWQQLCTVRNPEKYISDEKLDLFHDLRGKDDKEIDSSISDYTTQLESVERKIEVCNNERKKVQKIPEITNLRDEIQKKILIPTYRIEGELVRIYQRLTGEVDIFRVPSILTEENDFSLFFELQEMLPKAREADKLHSKFIELVKQQSNEQSSSQSDSDDESIAAIKSTISNANNSGNFFNSSILITRYLDELNLDKRRIKRELGRLKSWVKYREDITNQKSNKSKSRKSSNYKKRKFSDKDIAKVQSKMESGEGLSLSELNILLSKGSIFSEQKTDTKNSPKKRYSRTKRNISANELTAHRGSRGRSKNVRKE
ncbi:MAG: hypothetical protein NZ736_00085 [Candidatus Poseidoniaceae archaeon]|nr:hypothetical protein [Candidatus Poseidoniaceae archaeon]